MKEYTADSKTQLEYAGLRAPQAPPPGLQSGLHRKTTFCFSAIPAGNTVTPNIPQQPASSPPASAGNNLSHPSFFTEQISAFPQPTTILPARPANAHPPPIFLYRYPHNFPSSNTQQQPAGETCRLPIPSPIHFSFFFFPFSFLIFLFIFLFLL